MPHTIPTTDGHKTVASMAEVLAAGVIDPDYRLNWEAAFLGALWRESKGSGSAVIIHPTVCIADWWTAETVRPVPAHYAADEWQRIRVQGQRDENARRDRATLEVCSLVLMGYVEGRDRYARKLGAALGDFLVTTLIADHSVPTYHEMKAFLEGELDAHPVIAAAAAFAAMRYCNPERLDEVYRGWRGMPARGFWYGDKGWI